MTMFSDGMLLGAGGAGSLFTYVGGVGMERTTGTATHVVDAIPGVIAGDTLLCFMLNSNAASRTINSRPSGFSNVLNRANADGGNAILDIKTAGGSEPSTYSWVWNNATSTIASIMIALRAPTGINVNSAAFDTTTSDTQVLGSITPSNPGALIGFFASRLVATVSTPPAGMTARATTIGKPSTAALSAYSLDPSPSGATGAKTLIWSASAVVVGALVQLS